MIVDSSAVLAILFKEKTAISCLDCLTRAVTRRISAATYLEIAIVLERNADPLPKRLFDAFINEGRIVVEPVTLEQARIGRDAYRDFGKGSGHRAGLNYGDCFSYALARHFNEPLLFVGDDFTHTDIRSAN